MRSRWSNVEIMSHQRCGTFKIGCTDVVQRWKSDVGFCFIFNVGSTSFGNVGWTKVRWLWLISPCSMTSRFNPFMHNVDEWPEMFAKKICLAIYLWLFICCKTKLEKKTFFCKNICVFTKYTFFCRKNVFIWKKNFYNVKIFLLEKNFFYREKLYLTSEIYFYTENIFVTNKIWIFLKYIFILQKKIFLIIKNIFVKTSLSTQ